MLRRTCRVKCDGKWLRSTHDSLRSNKAKKSMFNVFSMEMKYGRIRILVALAETGENIAMMLVHYKF